MPDLLGHIPDEWGPKFEGPSGAATMTCTGPNEIECTAPSNMVLVMFTPQPGREVALNSDRKKVGMAPAGSIEVVPAGAELFARWRVDKENLLVALDDTRLRRLATLEFENDSFELQTLDLGHVDQRGLLLADLIREELLRGEAVNEDCLDSLLTVFGTYLLRHYSSTRRLKSPIQKGGLTPRAWKKIKDYIQSNLDRKLPVGELAQIARLSPSHFLRAFRQTTGHPPHQYVLASRLSYARQLITTTDMPFGAIAKASGFYSNSHMTSSIQKVWQTTPTALRRRK